MLKKIILLLALIMLTATSVEAADSDIEVLATTYTEGDSAELLVLMDGQGHIFFAVQDKTTGTMGLTEFSERLLVFYHLYEVEKNPLTFYLIVPEQERGQIDDDLGDWKDDSHILPIYANYSVENETVICEKPFYSATELNPSHYHATIKNPKYERLVEIFMTYMPRLNEVMASQSK